MEAHLLDCGSLEVERKILEPRIVAPKALHQEACREREREREKRILLRRLLNDIKGGHVDPLNTESLRLETVYFHGRRHSYNNRRLWVFKEAGCSAVPVHHKPLLQSFKEFAQGKPVPDKFVEDFGSRSNGDWVLPVPRNEVYPVLSDLADLDQKRQKRQKTLKRKRSACQQRKGRQGVPQRC